MLCFRICPIHLLHISISISHSFTLSFAISYIYMDNQIQNYALSSLLLHHGSSIICLPIPCLNFYSKSMYHMDSSKLFDIILYPLLSPPIYIYHHYLNNSWHNRSLSLYISHIYLYPFYSITLCNTSLLIYNSIYSSLYNLHFYSFLYLYNSFSNSLHLSFQYLISSSFVISISLFIYQYLFQFI